MQHPCFMPVVMLRLVSLLHLVVVKSLDDEDNLLWYSTCLEDAPETIFMDTVKGFFKVYKVNVQLSAVLLTFNCVSQGKKHIFF